MAAADWGEIWPMESGVGGAWGVSGGICTCTESSAGHHLQHTHTHCHNIYLPLRQGLGWLGLLLLLTSNGLCLDRFLLVLAAFVLEPDANDSWTEPCQLHQVLLEQCVWSGVAGIHSPQCLQLLL